MSLLFLPSVFYISFSLSISILTLYLSPIHKSRFSPNSFASIFSRCLIHVWDLVKFLLQSAGTCISHPPLCLYPDFHTPLREILTDSRGTISLWRSLQSWLLFITFYSIWCSVISFLIILSITLRTTHRMHACQPNRFVIPWLASIWRLFIWVMCMFIKRKLQ